MVYKSVNHSEKVTDNWPPSILSVFKLHEKDFKYEMMIVLKGVRNPLGYTEHTLILLIAEIIQQFAVVYLVILAPSIPRADKLWYEYTIWECEVTLLWQLFCENTLICISECCQNFSLWLLTIWPFQNKILGESCAD